MKQRPMPPHPHPVRNAAADHALGNRQVAVAVVATLVVFSLSSLPGSMVPRLRSWDKAAHMAEYLVLGLTYLNAATGGFRRITLRAVALYMSLLLLVGICDELYQSLIPRRTSDWRDLVADATGGLLALGLGLALGYRLGTVGPGRTVRKTWWDL